MTTLYIRSNLSDFTDTTGYSLTSGGPSAGVIPSNGDDVIFDASSGAARAVFGYLSCRSFTMAAGTGPITCDPSKSISVFGGNLSGLNGTFGLITVRAPSPTPASQGTSSLSCVTGTTIAEIDVVWGWRLQITSNVTVTQRVYLLASTSGVASNTILDIAAGCTLYTNTVNTAGDTGGAEYAILEGSGTLDLTGAVGASSGYGSTSLSGASVKPVLYVSAYSIVRPNTLRVSDTSPTTKFLMVSGTGAVLAPVNITLATGGNGGGCQLNIPATNFTISGTFDISRAGVVTAPGSLIYTAAAWNMSAPTSGNWLQPYSGTLYLKSSGVSQIQANSMKFTNVSTGGATYPTPATSIRAVNCTDGGGNTGITFLALITRFLSFF